MGSAVLDPVPAAPPRAAGAAGPAGVFVPNATLIRRLDLTASVARFVVRRDGPAIPHLAGQYLALGIWADGRLLQRPYSTASPPTASAELEFLIRRVPHGALTPRLWDLPPGARLRLGPPKGLLTLDPRRDRAAVFAASGTGLAPIISMLAAILEGPIEARPPRLIVLHGVSYVGGARLPGTPRGLGCRPPRPGLRTGGLTTVGPPECRLERRDRPPRWSPRGGLATSRPGAAADGGIPLRQPRGDRVRDAAAGRTRPSAGRDRRRTLLDDAHHGTFSPRPGPLTTPSIGSMRLLLVEDEPRMAALVRRVLTAEHHVVDVAPDGVSALAFTDGPAYDVVILDRMLPDLDGLEVLRLMRTRGSRRLCCSSRPLDRSRSGSPGSTPGRTTTWPSRSPSPSCWLASGRSVDGPRPRPRAACAPATWSWTSRPTRPASATALSISRPGNSPCSGICCATSGRSSRGSRSWMRCGAPSPTCTRMWSTSTCTICGASWPAWARRRLVRTVRGVGYTLRVPA